MGGFVINNYRTTLSDENAELAILSAASFRLSNPHLAPVIPILPDIGVFDDKELFMYYNGFEEEEPNEHLHDPDEDREDILAAVFDSDSDNDGDYVIDVNADDSDEDSEED
jgi:hypothetical protein